jgi:hypothetical protein
LKACRLDGRSAQTGRLFFKLSKPSDNSGGHSERKVWFLS